MKQRNLNQSTFIKARISGRSPGQQCLAHRTGDLGLLVANLNSTYAADPYEQMGGYVKRVMGLKVYLKIENADQLRIQRIFAGEEALKKDKRYHVAYVTRQGVPRDKYGTEHQDLEISAVEAIRALLKEGPFDDNSPLVFQTV